MATTAKSGRNPDAATLAKIRQQIHGLEAESAEQTPILVKELELQVLEFERRYEMASSEMARLLKSKKVRETADLAEWMWAFEVLQDIQNGTRTIGTR